jgi:hypothetical protein
MFDEISFLALKISFGQLMMSTDKWTDKWKDTVIQVHPKTSFAGGYKYIIANIKIIFLNCDD